MKRRSLISLILIVIFTVPVIINPDSRGLNTTGNNIESPQDSKSYTQSKDPTSGTGPSLPVSMTGTATDKNGGTLQIDSSTTDNQSITLDDGWTGSNLQATVDSMSVDITDALDNPTWDATHPEKLFIGSTSYWDDNVYVPDGWSVVKSEAVGDPHPHGTDWRSIYSSGSGYGGTAGFQFYSRIYTTSSPSDQVYFTQLVNLPYREIYSIEISFRYYVLSGYSTGNQVYLFARFGGIEEPFFVFESGDPVGSWQQATVTLNAEDLQSIVLPDALSLDIGMGTNSSYSSTALTFRAYIDEIGFTLNVRPYPELIGLQAGGTDVVGGVLNSTYQYEPDDGTRDAWDASGTGLDLNGNPYIGGDSDPSAGVYSSTGDWTGASSSQIGIQIPVDIPQGATITSAYLDVEPIASTYSTTMRIYASGFNTTGYPISPFTTGLPQLEDRCTWVNGSIDWEPASWSLGTRISSPEITSLIQKIVSDSNWTSGNYVCIMLDFMWASYYQAYNSLKGSYGSTYNWDELPGLYVQYFIPNTEDTWSATGNTWEGPDTVTVTYSTTSTNLVSLFPAITMDISGGGQTLDENFNDGTSFHVANDTIVDWTANFLIQPPLDTVLINAMVDYPLTEWKPIAVTNPIGQSKIYGTDWTYHDGKVVVFSDAVDYWGIWTIEFVSWNYVYDMELGPTGQSSYATYTFNVDDTAEFKVSSPWIQNAKTGLILTDPNDNVWYSSSVTTGAPGSTWDIPSFEYRVQLTVPAAQVSSTVINYPLLVSFQDTDFQTKVQASGNDFVFVQNGNVLAHEIDRFDQSTGSLVAYVRANLSSAVDNTFWLYYGNPVIGSTESPETLWSNGYDAVWLLNDAVTDEASGGINIDSTGHGYDGTQYGNSLTTGIDNGYGQYFDGNDYIEINSTENLKPAGDVTISGWFYIADSWSSSSTPSRLLVSKWLDGDNNFHIALTGSEYTETDFTAWGSLVFGFETSNAEYVKWTTRTSWTAGWYHFACVLDTSTPANNKIYINGVDNTDAGASGGASTVNLAFNGVWGIGGRYVETSEFPSGEAYHTGKIDDLRISDGIRTAGWINVEYNNGANPATFVVEGAKGTRTSPEHTLTKLIDSSAPAGLWTATVYYNDTGSTVSYATGLYERNFIVMHDSSLSLIFPEDAVSDKTAYAVAGDSLYIEVELTDNANANKIPGAQVMMNWSVAGTPTELTLNDIGNGRYGKSVNTSDLGIAGSYRININSYSQYYNNASDYIDLELYHATKLDYTDVDSTPIGFDFTATLIFKDTYDSTAITGATITFENGTAVTVLAQANGRYNISLNTNGMSYGDHSYVFKATKAGAFLEQGTANVTFTLRKHFTSVSVIGDLVTPYGQTTPVTVVIVDSDTGAILSSTSSISSWSFSSGYAPVNENNPSDFVVTLTTGTWAVGSEPVTLSVTMTGIYDDPADYQFDVQIRNHYTSVSVIGDFISPYGNTTSLTIVIYDSDTGATLSASDVSSFLFAPASYSNYPESNPTDLFVNLDTTSWTVGNETVTLSVVMQGHYDNPNDFIFDIQIRNHYTSVTVTGDFLTPHGQTTDITLIITDLDTGLALTASSVTSFTFTPASYSAQSDPSPSDLDFILDTSTWAVGTETVTLSVVMSGHYNNPADYVFYVDIRKHYTSVTVIGDFVTPHGYSTQVTIVIRDSDTGAVLSASDVSSFLFDPASYGNYQETNPSDLIVNLDTTSWAVATETVTLSVVMAGNYANPNDFVFDIQIRNHYTSATVIGNLTTAYGKMTSLTIVIRDSDTGAYLAASDVSSFILNPASYSDTQETNPTDLIVNLDTSSWTVGTEIVTLSIVMAGNYDNPANYDFNIQIRNHFTSITVTGNMVTPYSNVTPLTIVVTDLDTETNLSALTVFSFSFSSIYGTVGESSPTDLLYDLDTTGWSVGQVSVTLSIVMMSNYQNPSDYTFTITIRSVSTHITNEPSDLRYPTGSDFQIIVTVNVSEQCSLFGNPVTGLLQGEFTVENATQTIPIKEFHDLSNGRYNITIDAAYFLEGTYTISITVTPADDRFAESQVTIIFLYTPARSELSSPDRAVTTPYNTDFVVTLTFWDIDRDTGIDGAIITAIGISIYNQQDLGSGQYQVTVNVSGLAEGEHLYQLTADQIGYEAQTISFKVIIRIAYTYAIPTVGALNIPVGDDPVFYVKYWDIDHDVPITDSAPFLATSNWMHSVTITYIPAQERYRVVFITNVDDPLGNYIVTFTFSKGANYQVGTFNISVTIRTHNTDFRLVNAVEPVTYTQNITISVFYGDLDSGEGIASQYISFRVWDGTTNVIAYLYNVTGQPGYYTILVPAQQFGGLGLQNLTVYFNWTGPVSTYKDSYLFAAANILGEESRLSLLVTAEPTPYLEEMTYTIFYSAVNGTGISNSTGHVFISVEFVGETVDLNQVQIWEINQVTDPGKYSIQFNTDIFGKTGLIYMKVYINWAAGVEPYFTNRTDTISVRILARATLISISPPIQTPYGVNATFSFTYDDVSGETSTQIANDAKLTVLLSLSDYSISYNDTTKIFAVSFDTSQFGSLGAQSFTLDIIWYGAPFYANQTGRLVSVKVTDRQTVLDYQTPAPTQYMDNVTFSVTWTDVAETSTGIEGANIALYDGATPISSLYYTVHVVGFGVYSVELNTTYKATPGTYNIIVNITASALDFYYTSKEDSRSFTIRYRATILSSEPIASVPYSSSFTAILYYQDIITLGNIGNDSSLVDFTILNGSSWIYTIQWQQSLGYYLLTVETSNQATLTVGSINKLHISMSYAATSPFYGSDDAYISFEIRSRASSLERQDAPVPTPYLDNVTFTVYYSDADDLAPILSANIVVLKGVTPLVLGNDYFYSNIGGGVYEIIVQTTALNGLGVTTITVQVSWIGGAPYHDDASINIDLSVTQRTTNVEIVTPPSQTYYLENVTFVVSFLDIETGQDLIATKSLITVYNDATPLNPSEFSMTQIGVGNTYEISINSVIISTDLVQNRAITVSVDWPNSPNYYKDDSTSTSVTTIARRTYVSIERPGNTPFGENATFTFTFIDSTNVPEAKIARTGQMSITTSLTENPAISYDIGTKTFTVSFNTAQFGSTGINTFYINVNWAGTPFYANKTLQVVRVTITLRQTQLDFEAPAPTPYGDNVIFSVTYLDTSGVTDVGIPDATVSIYSGVTQIPGAYYTLTPDGFGNFEITLNTGYFSEPGYYSLNVSLVYTGTYFRSDASAVRTLNVRYRTTLLSSNPVGQVGFGTQIEVTLMYQDILTLTDIDDTFTTLTILNDTGTPWIYSINWQPATSTYLLVIDTAGQTTLTLGGHSLWLNMSYAQASPFYRWDDLYVQFTIRTRTSALDLQDAAIPAPFGENASFVVYYWDADVTQGIEGASFVLNSGAFTEGTDFFVVAGNQGVYTIYIDSTALGGLGTYSINVTAVWPGGQPYHDNAQRNVMVSTTRRTASVDILEPANQPRYLDNVTFTFAYVDSINGLRISSITASDIQIWSNVTQLAPGEYVLTLNGATWSVSINSTVLSSKLVKNFNVTVFVNWPDATSPFYQDDGTSMKITTTQRIILIEPQQIETTPIHDLMNISFILTDEDNDNPVTGAIILFSCVDPVRTLGEGSEYTLNETQPGVYLISVKTDFLVSGPGELGNFVFELTVQWNQANAPYYKNRAPIRLTGGVDLIQANMQAGVPTPSPVEITGNVTIKITVTDIDHMQGLNPPRNVINVHYYGTNIVPSIMNIYYDGAGVYSIVFSTIDLNVTGTQTMNITINYYPYTSMTVNPSFAVTTIGTSLTPKKDQIFLYWTQLADVTVYYNDLLHQNLTSGAILRWEYGNSTGLFNEATTSNGTYSASINTSVLDSGTSIVRIYASKDKYSNATITVTLIVQALPSDVILDSPSGFFEHPRGNTILVIVTLKDMYNNQNITYANGTTVFVTFEKIRYYMIQNMIDYKWYCILPSNATAGLTPEDTYSATIIADFVNYDPASAGFKLILHATPTKLTLAGTTKSKMDVTYNEIITFYLNYTETTYNSTMWNATVYWVDSSGKGFTEHFAFNSTTRLWVLQFNTSRMAYGTFGITFSGVPADTFYAKTTVDLTLTIAKIVTDTVIPIPTNIYWGEVLNLIFYYNDTNFDKGIANATAKYQWANHYGNATDLGGGYYSVIVDTTYLDTGVRYTVTVDFNKENYQVSTGIVSLIIQEVPTSLNLSTPSDNQVGSHNDELNVPFGDSIPISFFYKDIDNSDLYIGGLPGAIVTATIYGGGIVKTAIFNVTDFGNGTYYFVFDSTAPWLFELQSGIPQALPNSPYTITIDIELEHRVSYIGTDALTLVITIIDRPTTLEFHSDNVQNDAIAIYYGTPIDIYVKYSENWISTQGQGITNANITVSQGGTHLRYRINNATESGVYLLRIWVDAPLIPVGISEGYTSLKITLRCQNFEEKSLDLSVTILPTEGQKTMSTAISMVTPAIFLIGLLAVLWTRHFSIPKRLRQINSQIKAIKKGKIPKPIEESKTRQELVADLFNDTYTKLAITRTAAEMPENSVPITVPEITELLIQLSILTRLSQEELDEFNADITKMKMSEQAAFINEVIMQEAIRAARRDGKTVEEVLEDTRNEASRRLSSKEELEKVAPSPEEPEEERVLLVDEEEIKEPEPTIEPPTEEGTIPSEKLSSFEIEELKADLLKKGVPAYEVHQIIEQAKHLSRELVEELIKSLGLEK